MDITSTKLWGLLDEYLQYPHDVLEALFTGLGQHFGQEAAASLFHEQWLVDCTERWVPFGELANNKADSLQGEPVLPTVLDEFRTLLFAVVRFVHANSRDVNNLGRTDQQYLDILSLQHGLARVASPGDDNNCLIYSIANGLFTAGFIAFPERSRRGICQSARSFLIASDGLHPRSLSGAKDETAFLEHFVHAEAIVRYLHSIYGKGQLPPGGINLTVHARYDTEQAPADPVLIACDQPGNGVPCQLNLYNWCGRDCSGLHYDLLT